MLQAMQQLPNAQCLAKPPSFAGLLAALTQPEKKKPIEWSEDGLADDVTTLSYERALQTHSRYRPANASDMAIPDDCDLRTGVAREASSMELGTNRPFTAPRSEALQTAADQDLRRMSVTIRLSEAESVRLRNRAAEAGLTVSSYLRSCAFEAETLRAQVKAALAELKASAGQEKRNSQANLQPSWFGWLNWSHLLGKLRWRTGVI
jgi:hypothetical protein